MTIPAIRLSSVVLPEPLRPIRPTASPGSTESETSTSARTSVAFAPSRASDELLERPHRLRVDAEAAGSHGRPGSRQGSYRRGYCERPLDDRGKNADEGRVVVRHLDPIEPQAELPRPLARLGVEIPADLEVVGDEPDRAEENVLDPRS